MGVYEGPVVYEQPSFGMSAGTAALAGGAAGLIGGMLLEGALEHERREEYIGGGFGPVFGGGVGDEQVITDVRTDMFGDREVTTEVIDRDMFGNVEDVQVTETEEFW